MSFDILIDFFKKVNYKRILPLLAFPLLFISLSPVRAFAVESEYSGVLENSFQFTNESKTFTMEVSSTYGTPPGQTVFEPFQIAEDINGNITFFYNNGSFNNTVNRLSFYNVNSRFAVDFAPNLYDYYLILTVANSYSDTLPAHTQPLDLGANPRVSMLYAEYGDTDLNSLSSVDYSSSSYQNFFKFSSGDTQGYNFVVKFNPRTSNNNWPCGIQISNNTSFPCIGNVLMFKGVIVAMPISGDKSADFLAVLRNIYDKQVNIDENLSTLYQFLALYGIPESMGGVGSIIGQDTEQIFSGLIGGNAQLDSYINQYTQVEQSMHDKFFQNQTAVQSNFTNWSWGSLATCVDWTSDYLNRIYDNSGDFRTMFMYPILAGIALIFIGRQGMAAYVRSKNNKRGD